MDQKTQTKTNMDIRFPEVLKDILEELRLLRNEVMLLLPQEDLEEYAHPERIKNSYKKAIKKYSPTSLSSLWK